MDIVGKDSSVQTTGMTSGSAETPATRLPKVSLQIPVAVYSGGENGESYIDECETVQVDPQGALLAMTRTIVAGQAILLFNSESGYEMVCQVQSVIPDESGLNYVEIQFPKVSPKFWPVPFPADGFAAVERESQQTAAPATATVPETETATNSEATEILKGQEKTAELQEKPNAKPLSEPEPYDLSDSDAAQTAQATETAENSASPENSGPKTTRARRPVRRSPRVRMQIPVLVSLPGEASPTECNTVEVGAYGALLVTPKEIDVGQALMLTNPSSLKRISCRVRNVMQIGPGVYHIAVEFAIESTVFWGRAFPFGEWDSSQAKPAQRPKPPAAPSSRKIRKQATLEIEMKPATEPPVEVRSSKKGPAFVVAGLLGLILLGVGVTHKWNTAPATEVSSIYNDVAAEEARLIPGIEKYRLATLGDFNPDTVSWLNGSGQKVTGQVSGAFAAYGQSRVYVLVGDDKLWRIVILANGKLRCDAQYRGVAIVARVPKGAVQKINWADPPPADAEGDGLLVVRAANDFGTSVVLFLRGDQVVSGTPSDYRQIPFDQAP